MDVYFTASITGKNDYGNNYKKIVSVLESLGHVVISKHILDVSEAELAGESMEQREEHFKKVKKWMSGCDMVVAEVSFPSTNVGYEISMALEREKPVLCLHVHDKVPVLLIGNMADRLRVVEYSVESLSRTLKMYVEELSETTDTRFNFFVSPKISGYLDWIAKVRRIPRAVYLRRLIEEDMKKNKDLS